MEHSTPSWRRAGTAGTVPAEQVRDPVSKEGLVELVSDFQTLVLSEVFTDPCKGKKCLCRVGIHARVWVGTYAHPDGWVHVCTHVYMYGWVHMHILGNFKKCPLWMGKTLVCQIVRVFLLLGWGVGQEDREINIS